MPAIISFIFVLIDRIIRRPSSTTVFTTLDISFAPAFYADTVGVALDWQMRFTVISACGSNLSQRLIGKSSAVPANILRKCALKFLIATSAAFLL